MENVRSRSDSGSSSLDFYKAVLPGVRTNCTVSELASEGSFIDRAQEIYSRILKGPWALESSAFCRDFGSVLDYFEAVTCCSQLCTFEEMVSSSPISMMIYLLSDIVQSHNAAKVSAPSCAEEPLSHCLKLAHRFITLKCLNDASTVKPNENRAVVQAIKFISVVYAVNLKYRIVRSSDFYNDIINDMLEIKDDFPIWKSKKGFSFCNFPFILNPSVKYDVLKVESLVQMRHELQDAFFRSMFGGLQIPYLVIEIRRDYIIRDAMIQLERLRPQDLKKQLRVQFVLEEGIDEGGLQKEFFQLAIREIFDPKYGMFSMNEQSGLYWFLNQHNSSNDELLLQEYKLIGKLIGLAIYNSVILDLHFPSIIFKKLLDEPVTLDDLSQLDPSLGQGLRALLAFDPPEDVEQVFQRSFTFEYEVFGQYYILELKPGGAAIPLAGANRQEYVDLFLETVTGRAIEKPFLAFREGFYEVCRDTAVKIFRPEEFEALVCGSLDLNFQLLEQVTLYDGGYSRESPVIRYFWQVVHSFTDDQKRKLLFFTTGSDRIPIGGMGKTHFVIAKNGPHSDRLPTSHTCFNVLLLCEYRSAEQLKERLLTAIQNSEGFGLI